MSINELQSKVNELRELYRMADELESEIDAIQDAIKAHMAASGVDTLNGTNYKITWKASTRSHLNARALREENPELIARYTTQKTIRSFCLT